MYIYACVCLGVVCGWVDGGRQALFVIVWVSVCMMKLLITNTYTLTNTNNK